MGVKDIDISVKSLDDYKNLVLIFRWVGLCAGNIIMEKEYKYVLILL